ncbi:MAG TPA: glycosyltransferase [Candidatus Nanoarchaeia archaeon]|nr:glycosyltransferase [Candidatus Nanoarchaeia archaeon]
MSENRCQNGTEPTPLTSIVILSYNRLDDLRDNLVSLDKNTGLPYEVIIFDNNSEQATREYLQSIDNTCLDEGNGVVKVIYSDKNLGCSGGRKEAVKYATGDYIYTVDNDMTYTPHWLEALIERMEQDQRIGAVSSKIVYPNGKVQLNGGYLHLEEDYFGSFEEVDQDKDQFDLTLSGEKDCDWLCGGATLFRREVAEQVEHSLGYLNGFEDYDYSFQIADLGYRLANCPSSTVIHHHIGFDEEKQKKETAYLRDRWNPERTWASLVHFLERTGINMIKTTGFYDWIEKDGSKPFLKWGAADGKEFEYKDLFPGKAFSELTNEELRLQFDQMITKNREMREGTVHRFGQNYSCGNIIESIATEIDQGFSRYNRANLGRHLDWIIEKKMKMVGSLSDPEISYLIDQFKTSAVEREPEAAQTVYDLLRQKLQN